MQLSAILLVSSLAVAVDSAAGNANRHRKHCQTELVSASWVRINGVINQWGTTPVRGQLQTQARAAVLQTADTSAVNISHRYLDNQHFHDQSKAFRAKENFTYIFYAARLTNASVSTVKCKSQAPTSSTAHGM